MKTTAFKTIICIVLLAVTGIILSCEKEEENSAPSCIIDNVTEGQEVERGNSLIIWAKADDSDGKVVEISIYIDDQIVVSGTESPLGYIWETADQEPALHTIKALAKDNVGATGSGQVSVIVSGVAPEVDFTSDTTEIFLGNKIQFTDYSIYEPTSWLWDFGDGNTSTKQNPLYTYTTGGEFTVSLTAGNEYGTSIKEFETSITVVDTLVRDYDGNVYKVVKIGEQYWMAENLKSTHYADGTAMVDGTAVGNINGDYTSKYYFAYDDNESNVAIYGRLYTWAAVMNGAASSNEVPSGVQGVCPDNWHVPSKAEWETLIDYAGGAEIAGGMLKETSYDYWNFPNTAASDAFGFMALPAGGRSWDYFFGINTEAFFPTSTQDGSSTIYYISLYNNQCETNISGSGFKDAGSSVRCVRD